MDYEVCHFKVSTTLLMMIIITFLWALKQWPFLTVVKNSKILRKTINNDHRTRRIAPQH